MKDEKTSNKHQVRSQKSNIIWFLPTIFLFGFLLSWMLRSSLISRYGIPSEIPLKKIHDTIMSDFYQSGLEEKDLYYESINGMLKSLNDVYAKYYPPKNFNNFAKMTHGKFAGLGIQIRLEEDGYLRVISPIKGTPAHDAGIISGDKIIEVDGEDAKFKTSQEATEHLSGEPGSKVEITVKRWKTNEIIKLMIEREIIKSPSVVGAEILRADSKKIGYLRLISFQDSSAKDLKKEIQNLVKQNIDGLILDVRDNHGGQLNITNEIVDLFIPKGKLIVSTIGKNTEMNYSYWTSADTEFEDLPLVLLVNRESASASEILAGAFQDYQRAIIIGERTYGKGKVQQTYETKVFDKPSAFKFTTALYFTPSGRCIHKSTAKKYCPKCFRLYDEISYPEYVYCPHDKEKLELYESANYYRGGIEPDIQLSLTVEEEEGRIVEQNLKEIIGDPFLSDLEKEILAKDLIDKQLLAGLNIFNNIHTPSQIEQTSELFSK